LWGPHETKLGGALLSGAQTDYGYNVVLVVDAMTDRDADAHRHSVEKIFPRLGQTDTTENVLKVLRG
jgi:isochorismate hydrolase